jgi:Flp pilus assembly protein TadB
VSGEEALRPHLRRGAAGVLVIVLVMAVVIILVIVLVLVLVLAVVLAVVTVSSVRHQRVGRRRRHQIGQQSG